MLAFSPSFVLETVDAKSRRRRTDSEEEGAKLQLQEKLRILWVQSWGFSWCYLGPDCVRGDAWQRLEHMHSYEGTYPKRKEQAEARQEPATTDGLDIRLSAMRGACSKTE